MKTNPAHQLERAAQELLDSLWINERSRWPCPDCGRPNASASLRSVTIGRMDTSSVITGCTLYVNHSKLLALRDALRAAREARYEQEVSNG